LRQGVIKSLTIFERSAPPPRGQENKMRFCV
jgi:hypothetical protein